MFSRSGRVLHRLSGKWHEGLYRGTLPGGQCIWKPSKWGGRGGLGRGEGGSGTVHLPQPLAFPPDSMPPDHERNFGFTQFALELNELTAELKRSLPSTDTRLRPDQRSVSGRPHPGTVGSSLPDMGFHTELGLPFLLGVASGRWVLCVEGAGQGIEALGLEGAVPLTAVWKLRYLEEGNIQAAEAQKRRIEQLQRDRRRVMEENNIVHQARFFRYLCPLPGSLPSRLPSSSLSGGMGGAQLWEAASGNPGLNSACSPLSFPQAADRQQWEGVVGD